MKDDFTKLKNVIKIYEIEKLNESISSASKVVRNFSFKKPKIHKNKFKNRSMSQDINLIRSKSSKGLSVEA